MAARISRMRVALDRAALLGLAPITVDVISMTKVVCAWDQLVDVAHALGLEARTTVFEGSLFLDVHYGGVLFSANRRVRE